MARMTLMTTGDKFNRLTVIEFSHQDKFGFPHWRFQCDCGKECVKSGSLVRRSLTKSCGCLQVESGRTNGPFRRKGAETKIGDKCGRWTVVEFKGRVGARYFWLLKCDCGTERVCRADTIRSGKSVSCGCSQIDSATTHGMHGTSTYKSWRAMIDRCENPNATCYWRYGGKGIKVCERWHSFENFLADMNVKPSPKHSIDRFPNQGGGYEPGNCRWATSKEQARNKKSNVLVELNGRMVSAAEAAEITGIRYAKVLQMAKAKQCIRH